VHFPRKTRVAAATSLALASTAAFAETVTADHLSAGVQAQRLQQQNLDAVLTTGQLGDALSAESAARPAPDLTHLPAESTCFPIREVVLNGNRFSEIEAMARAVEGQCVGAAGLRVVQDALANELIDKGFLTSRVTVPPQSLASGKLMLDIAVGRVGEVRHGEGGRGSLKTAVPMHAGSIFNQRAIDQSLENIRRLPSQADARFDIVPGAEPGTSDIVAYPGSGKRWQAAIGYDNAGNNATGKHEFSGSLTVDSPLGLYDQAQVYGLTNADRGAPGKGIDTLAAAYSVPLGYAMLSLDASQALSLQSIPTDFGIAQFSGKQKYAGVKLSAVVHRNARSRTELRTRFYRAISTNGLNGAELISSRDVCGFEVGASHRRYIGNVQVDASAGWNQTLPGISKLTGYVIDAGKARTQKLGTASLSAVVPFRLGGQAFSYQTSWNAQNARTPVSSADYYTIGSRFSVRGFDQQSTLAAESGWTLSNELDWYAPTPVGMQSVYLGVDAGRVRGPTARYLPGNTLVGMTAGVRGALSKPSASSSGVTYDASIGWPLSKPAGFSNHSPTLLTKVSVLI
jgi:hemolysin activation/secretion protein